MTIKELNAKPLQPKKSILAMLEERMSDRPGEEKQVKFKRGNNKSPIDGYVFIQALTAAEVDRAKAIGEVYAMAEAKRFDMPLTVSTYNEILDDAQACAAIALAVLDPITKDKVFNGPGEVDKIRKLMTEEELFYLHQICSIVSYSISPAEEIDDDRAMELALMASEGNTTPLENMHVLGLIQIIATLSKKLMKKEVVDNESAF